MSSYILYPGEWLELGHSLKSEDGTVEFSVQADGRLVLSHSGQCVFQTEQRNDIKGLKMKRDGNLCLWYVSHPSTPLYLSPYVSFDCGAS